MTESDIAEFLLANPAFFDEHADLLSRIRLSSPHGDRAVSLPERQMEKMREKTRVLEHQLSELVRYGHENDKLSQKFVRWTTRLLGERDPAGLPEAVTTGLRDAFDVPDAVVRLWAVDDAFRDLPCAASVSDAVRLFASGLSVPYCGGEGGVGGTEGFADWFEPAPASLAVVALRDPVRPDDAPFGLLALASPDAARFRAGMGTDLLEQIGAVAAAALSRLRSPA
ncbi:DUF484 family protein [Chitinasiproducens palmae]|nr:DUF484 family protein [Chitinasiproducens palmae]